MIGGHRTQEITLLKVGADWWVPGIIDQAGVWWWLEDGTKKSRKDGLANALCCCPRNKEFLMLDGGLGTNSGKYSVLLPLWNIIDPLTGSQSCVSAGSQLYSVIIKVVRADLIMHDICRPTDMVCRRIRQALYAYAAMYFYHNN